MPLSAPAVDREHLHTRTYEFQGFRRSDGLWDIEGHIVDTKTYGFPNAHRGRIDAGEPIHDMSIRLTLDEDFEIKAIEAVTDDGPFGICPAITPNFQRMVGVRVGPGWRREVRSRLGGVEGCTHLVELLIAMATPAYQAMFPVRQKRSEERKPGQKPALLNSCHAFSETGQFAKENWPDVYTGE
jgi:hypothetical protein